MITVIMVGVIAVMFAYIAQFKRTSFGLKFAFLVIFLFLALRYNYGNDYRAYYYIFLDNSPLTFDSLKNFYTYSQELRTGFANTSDVEPGWKVLCTLFQPVGFFAMVAVLALFNCIVYYFFIKKYVPPPYYWLAVFLYIFTPGLMLVHASAMRQSVAISLFLISINYIYKKDLIRYALLVCLAVSFHASAIIMLPLYLLGMLNFKINKPIAIVGLSLFLSFFFIGGTLVQILDLFVGSNALRYQSYIIGGTTIGTGLGIILSSICLILILFYDKYQNKEISIQFKIAIISFFFIPLSIVVMALGRIDMYFQPVLITVYPMIFLKMDKLIFKYSFMVIIILWTLYGFGGFFQSDTFQAYFSTYNTILSAPEIY